MSWAWLNQDQNLEPELGISVWYVSDPDRAHLHLNVDDDGTIVPRSYKCARQIDDAEHRNEYPQFLSRIVEECKEKWEVDKTQEWKAAVQENTENKKFFFYSRFDYVYNEYNEIVLLTWQEECHDI